jgi:mRNA interferase MazF
MRWGIFRARLDPVEGSEQGGIRPVLVISYEEFNRLMPVVTVLPITSAREGRRIYSNEVLAPAEKTGLPRDSIILVHQIRTISQKRLGERYGVLIEPSLREAVREALTFHLLEED